MAGCARESLARLRVRAHPDPLEPRPYDCQCAVSGDRTAADSWQQPRQPGTRRRSRRGRATAATGSRPDQLVEAPTTPGRRSRWRQSPCGSRASASIRRRMTVAMKIHRAHRKLSDGDLTGSAITNNQSNSLLRPFGRLRRTVFSTLLSDRWIVDEFAEDVRVRHGAPSPRAGGDHTHRRLTGGPRRRRHMASSVPAAGHDRVDAGPRSRGYTSTRRPEGVGRLHRVAHDDTVLDRRAVHDPDGLGIGHILISQSRLVPLPTSGRRAAS